MNYSRNIRAHALYSGILGAFLEPNNNITNNIPDRSTHDITIQRAAAWLAQNNPYLRPYTNMLSIRQNQESNNPFPMASYTETNDDAPINPQEIIIPNYDFPDEVHNEDFHYTRLMAGFTQQSETLRLPITTYDPNLEPLLFPDIFTDGKGHFHDILNRTSPNDVTREETFN
ncbi:hypothetical protein RhiirA4_406162 [Rhizophagus irregularis]|uniref:Uncharacterized protein n=1 Tax=Rhizophagus irregularis TaxID=588596 RepID=A0A2I1GU40_9GLOM|nr:hypothetical protein RhiirA4_406162 [Rhizophagus irregularis]